MSSLRTLRTIDNRKLKLILSKYSNNVLPFKQTTRAFSIVPIISRVLKLRYLIFGSVVGGGIAASKKYEELKSNLPDFSWIQEYVSEDTYNGIVSGMKSIYDTINPPTIDAINDSLSDLRNFAKFYFERFKDVEEAGDTNEDSNGDVASLSKPLCYILGFYKGVFIQAKDIKFVNFQKSNQNFAPKRDMTDKERLQRLQDEIMAIQLKYQRELEKYEKENKELKKQLLLQKEKLHGGKVRKIKKSLIDMYSEVLDELSEYDSTYNIQDHLPRVVVIGDQSAGKTSVLEMIAQARIFPRGGGEMMTRSPVKVTLSEGPYHVAQFKDSKREFDLTKESELAALRNEIELRMKNSIKGNQTISNEVISLSVKGPGLSRMVLVDLPGIISTETQGMANQTKDSIIRLANVYMSNPNAIILCIQDGSIDAERSNVTDLVSKMDPQGKRTIFVLTKFDLAESNQFNPERMKRILEGKLFPMKALGYFAVITGRGNSEDSIETIKDYEEQFFSNSKLLRDGILLPNQMTTRNLSFAVSDIFWKMVKESIEQQADTFKATRYNLETEWKNTYPNLRELDRDELFEKARGEILDEVINLAQIRSKDWEEAINKLLRKSASDYFFNSIYMPACQTESLGSFNTSVDIKLKQWAERQLPKECVDVGTKALLKEFENLITKDNTKKNHDNILDNLKVAIKNSARLKHKWDDKALESLRVIQLNALEDRSVPDKSSWDAAIAFMDSILRERLNEIQDQIKEFKGPSFKERWLKWQYTTEEQKDRGATINELERLLKSFEKLKQNLNYEELTTVRKNLEGQKVYVDIDYIRDTWDYIYTKNFLQKKLQVCADCKKFYFHYLKGFIEPGIECHDIVLFWRLKKMLEITCTSLRQQIINIEVRRLEREVKDILDEYGQDETLKVELLKGKRVELAEELKRVRVIQAKLEEFINCLNSEKN